MVGQTSRRIDIPSEDDDYDDPDETVYQMTLLPLPSPIPEEERSQYWTLGESTTATITVTDNDLPVVGVTPVKDSYPENQSGEFRLTRVGQTDGKLSVKAVLSETGNSYYDLYDYLLGQERTFTFTASQAARNQLFFLQNQDGHEADGSVTFRLLAGDGYRIDPDRSVATFTVTETDPMPTLAVSNATASEGAGHVVFRVSLSSTVSPPSRQTVSVDYRTVADTAAAGEDYRPTTGTLTIGPRRTSATIRVPILDNNLAEMTETFSIVLSNPVNAVLEDDQHSLTAVGTIRDDEPFVALEPVAAEVDEGESIRLKFTRSGDNIDRSQPLTVHFVGGYRDSRSEWLETVIPAGSGHVTWDLPTEDDDLDLPDRTYLVLVVSPEWREQPLYYSSEPTRLEITVRDNDLPQVTIEPVHEGRTEGEPVEFTLTRRGRLDMPLTVKVGVTQTSDSSSDQADFISGTPPATVTFAIGSDTAVLTVPTSADFVTEPHATIAVSITDEEDDGYRTGDPSRATVRIIDNDRFNTTSLSLSVPSDAVEEGEDAVFVLSRSGATNLDLTARVRVVETKIEPVFVLGTARLEHIVTDHEVMFQPGDQTATLTIPTVEENLNDGNSSFKATLLLSHFYDVNPFPSTGIVWVRDDDLPTVSFTVAHAEHVESEDTAPLLTITRTGDTSGVLYFDISHEYIARYRPPVPSTFFRALNRPYSLAFGEGDATRTWPAHPRFVGPDGGEGTVRLWPGHCESVPGDCGYYPQYLVGEIPEWSVTVYNNAAGVAVEPVEDSVVEGNAATFKLTRYGGNPGNTEYPLTARVAATQNGRFIDGATPQTVTFAGYPDPPALTATVTIPTLDDDDYEADGAITLTVLPPEENANLQAYYEFPGGSTTGPSATVAVTDNDEPALSISDATASEAAGVLEFTVTVEAVERPVTVQWATSSGTGDDAATADEDYTASSGTLTFGSGDTVGSEGEITFDVGQASETISIEILDDGVREPDETFSVTLSNPTGAVLGRAVATGTIRDDEPETPPIVTLWTPQKNVVEGQPASFKFFRQVPEDGITQSADILRTPLTINLRLTETGDFIGEALENYAGVRLDYTPGEETATLTIPPSHGYFTVEFSTEDDQQPESNGAITLSLAEGPGYTIGEYNEATVNIRDNDLGISISDAEAHNEGVAGINFTVTLSKPSDQEVTVDVATADGTATSGQAVTATSLGRDFVPKSATLTFAPGTTSQTFTVVPVDDTFDEPMEDFTVELSNPSGNAVLLDASATGAISDNDAKMQVGVHREGKRVNEDSVGPVEFRFRLTPAPGSGTTASERLSTVRWTVVEGTATAGEDYVAVGGLEKTQIPPGVLSKTVGVTLLDDELFEQAEETFTFELKNAVLLDVNADHQSIEVSISDNESIQVGVAADSANVGEGDDASFTVSLTPSRTAVPIEVEYLVIGTAGQADYLAPSGRLTIPAGQTSGAVTITTVLDNLLDPDETLGVQLTRARGGGREVTLPDPEDSPTVTILDEGVLFASVVSGEPATEGAAAEFTIQLSIATDVPVHVDWQTSDSQGGRPASADVDYSSASDTVIISPGATSATVSISTLQDNLVEGDETFVVNLQRAARGADSATATNVPLGVRSAEGTIVDDDVAPTAITLTVTPDRLDEDAGETELTVTATLDGATRLPTDVPVDLTLRGSGLGDGPAVRSVLTIPAAQASGVQTVTVTPVNDRIAGDDRQIRVVGAADGFNVTRATVTITEDDDPPTGVILTVLPGSVTEGAGTTPLTVTGVLTGGDLSSVDTELTLSVEGVSLPPEDEDGEPTVAATSGIDFTGAEVKLVIPSGQSTGTATIELAAADDDLAEGQETAQVSATSDGLAVTPAPLTIEDNDRAPDRIELSALPNGVAEDDGTVDILVTATLAGGVARTADTTVTLSVHNGSAVNVSDYLTTSQSAVVTIRAGRVSGAASLRLTLVDDNVYEDTEQVVIRGANDDPGLPVRGVRVSITDDEEKPTVINLVLDKETIAEEGGSQHVTVTARIQGPSTRSDATQVSLSLDEVTGDGFRLHRLHQHADHSCRRFRRWDRRCDLT